MNTNDLMAGLSIPEVRDPFAPKREIELSTEDIDTVHKSIDKLDKSGLNKDDLFEIFSDWQTKKTLTSKRIFVSTSILVVSASWIGVDFTELTVFGLKVANGSPSRFVAFVLISIIMSGIFYEASRRIDGAVRKARIIRASQDIDELKEPVEAVKKVIEQNDIKSFNKLYYDFKSSTMAANQHDAIDVYNAVRFYFNHLSTAGVRLNAISVAEQFIIYSIAFHAVVVLVWALLNNA